MTDRPLPRCAAYCRVRRVLRNRRQRCARQGSVGSLVDEAGPGAEAAVPRRSVGSLPLGHDATGQAEWCSAAWATRPSWSPRCPGRRRAPTTSRSASREASTQHRAGGTFDRAPARGARRRGRPAAPFPGPPRPARSCSRAGSPVSRGWSVLSCAGHRQARTASSVTSRRSASSKAKRTAAESVRLLADAHDDAAVRPGAQPGCRGCRAARSPGSPRGRRRPGSTEPEQHLGEAAAATAAQDQRGGAACPRAPARTRVPRAAPRW